MGDTDGAQAGSSPGLGRVPVEWDADSGASRPIAVEQFDYESLDSLADRLRELLEEDQADAGPALELLCEEIFRQAPIEILEQVFRRVTRLALEEAVKYLIGTCLELENPKEMIHYLGAQMGHSSMSGKSIEEVAREFGKRKQAAYQAIDWFAERTGIRIHRPGSRGVDARRRMRKRNFRHQNFFRPDLLKQLRAGN